MKKNKFIKCSLLPLTLAIVALLCSFIFRFSPLQNSYKPYTSFVTDLNNNKLSKIYMSNNSNISVMLKNGDSYETENPRTPSFKEEILLKGVKVEEQEFLNFYTKVSLSLFIIFLLFFIITQKKYIGKNFKKSSSVDHMEVNEVSNVNFNFSNVAGNEEAKESVQDIIDFLKNPEKYSAYGARMPKGVMLYGDPGTGKTLLAKAVAGEANVPFFALSGSDFVQVYVGVGASRIRQVFKKARASKKAVIFIDEIDAIGKKRGSSSNGSGEEKDQTLNALLTEMSGFNEKEGIVVMAATNRLDVLDSALLRPGRFDRQIEVTLPDLNARKKILELHLKNKPVNDINLELLAKKTSYFSGAKLESLVNEAAILACKENSPYISNEHLEKSFSIMSAGYDKKDRSSLSDFEKKITAYHEIGHALSSAILIPDDKISKVSIIPTTKGAGGYTLTIGEDKMYYNKTYIRNKIKVLLAGRAAEEIVFGEDNITTGAYNDIQKCSELCLNMVTKYGMGQSISLLNLHSLNGGNVTNDIIKECRDLIDALYNETKELLLKNKVSLENLSAKLLEEEVLFEDEFKKVI